MMFPVQVKYVMVDPAKHHLHLTDPEAVLPHLKSFLGA